MEDAPRLLPDDVLADILARLPPRSLAVSRSVCTEWRAVIDARCKLRADLLPIMIGGIFIRTNEADTPEFFVRPSMAHKITADLEYYHDMDEDCKYVPDVEDSCNGLLLLEDHVVNPATRQWVRLPPYPALFEGGADQGYYYRHLVFDPTLSPHYEVVAMKGPPHCKDKLFKQGLEWPPSECMMRIYSSTTGRWEERPFARKGREITISHLPPGVSSHGPYHGVYWHGALYLHWSHFSMRINLSNDTYQVINLPIDGIKGTKYYNKPHIGKSKNGVHLVVADDERRLQVWFLHEFGDNMEWVLKHAADLQDIKLTKRTDRPWILQDRNNNQANKNKIVLEKELDWDSDDDDAVAVEKWDEKCPFYYIEVLGFHPYREIVLMLLSRARPRGGYALGRLRFKHRYQIIDAAFTYTSCWIGGFRKQLI